MNPPEAGVSPRSPVSHSDRSCCLLSERGDFKQKVSAVVWSAVNSSSGVAATRILWKDLTPEISETEQRPRRSLGQPCPTGISPALLRDLQGMALQLTLPSTDKCLYSMAASVNQWNPWTPTPTPNILFLLGCAVRPALYSFSQSFSTACLFSCFHILQYHSEELQCLNTVQSTLRGSIQWLPQLRTFLQLLFVNSPQLFLSSFLANIILILMTFLLSGQVTDLKFRVNSNVPTSISATHFSHQGLTLGTVMMDSGQRDMAEAH